MRTYLTEVISAQDASTATTKTEEISIKDPITSLSFRMKGTNSSSTPTAHPAKMISKIEVKDGSELICSGSMQEFQAMQYWTKMRQPFQTLEYRNDVMCIPTVDVFFGRWPFDPDFCLDPEMFKNLSVHVTHNKASGGSAPDAGNLEVIAQCFGRRSARPQGYLKTCELYSYSLTSSAEEPIRLNDDETLRQLMIQSLAAQKQPWEQYNEVRWIEGSDAAVVLDDKTSDLLKPLSQEYGPWIEKIMGSTGATAVPAYCTPTYETGITMTPLSTTAGYFACAQSYGGYFSPKGSATLEYNANVIGYAPHGSMGLVMGDLDDSENWWNPEKNTKSKLKITAGSSVGSSSTCEIVTQAVKSY